MIESKPKFICNNHILQMTKFKGSCSKNQFINEIILCLIHEQIKPLMVWFFVNRILRLLRSCKTAKVSRLQRS